MGSNSRMKKTSRFSIMNAKGKSSSYYSYAVLGICIACLPLLVAAGRRDSGGGRVVASRKPVIEQDLMAAESQNVRATQRAPQSAQSAPVPTAIAPGPIGPPPSPPSAAAASDSSISSFPAPFGFPKSDWAGSPSNAPRYAIPPTNPWKDQGFPFPSEVANFRRRAQADEEAYAEDDYKPSESKGKKHSPSVFKRVRNGIRNTGKAIVGAPSYILKKYRGTWKKLFGGGKKKKGGWKAWSSSSDKNDGWGNWEEADPSGGYEHEPSHYPEKGWSSGKGPKGGNNDSHERRYDNYKDSGNTYRDYKDREYRDRDYKDDYKDYDNSYRSTSSRPRDRSSKPSPNYREETHYDDYDGRKTTAYYGPSRKSPPSSKRPYNKGSGSHRYDDEY